MHLKKLEISGFKSFAKHTVLEFPSKVTAVVGPNGSGKSNIKESIQWVLGEQSMKSLRGKKGEDLIWNGSPPHVSGSKQVPRMGKASVTLTLDNKDGRIPLDFEEIVLARKIFRDGINEYYLNGTQVRLKDVVELIARMGLGETKHNIIGQGEVDRILLASPREKREMLEEALGLRVYQLKKNETERKLDSTQNNMKQVEALLREITPHLKFLRIQAEKHKTREQLELDLKNLQKNYLSKERKEIAAVRAQLQFESEPLFKRKAEIEKETKNTLQKITEAEKSLNPGTQTNPDEKKLLGLENSRRELERELGRLEGRLEVEKSRDLNTAGGTKARPVDADYIREEIKGFITEIKTVLDEEDRIEAVRTHLQNLADDLEKLLQKIQKGTVEIEKTAASKENPLVAELQKSLKKMHADLAETSQEIEKLNLERSRRSLADRTMQMKIREYDSSLRTLQNEERDLSMKLERLMFAEEKLKEREGAWRQVMHEARMAAEDIGGEIAPEFINTANEELKKKIDRLHLKLEEVGGIDATVIKEFSELDARHSHLSKELEDLKQAHIALKELLKELDGHIKNNFKEGFAKIKEEFNKYFRVIFGGGKASLYLIKPVVRAKDEESELPPDELPQEGVELLVELPRKRTKGLAMLSGGERALTSIALLFAITAINPPPFLILDETDAALDEANTQRYAAMLKELSEKTQLIIVTHNRETMKSAGILYGVTMDDGGVSKLLSLRLEEAEVYTNR